jgi:hypothetical protein
VGEFRFFAELMDLTNYFLYSQLLMSYQIHLLIMPQHTIITAFTRVLLMRNRVLAQTSEVVLHGG